MSTFSSDDGLRKAGQITVAFLTLYWVTFLNILRTKRRLLRQAQATNKTFDRYASPQMRNADRLNANFLEWSPIFLGLLWSLAATASLSRSSVAVAWTYVGLRTLYIVLLITYGVASDGLNKALWVSTAPAYFCLMYLWVQACRSLLLP